MKKKNKIIIGIAVIVIAIIVVIVSITVNNHQKAVKEAEAISVSVETSKNDLISDYQKQYQAIISDEYKTEAEYNSAKNSLSTLKDEIAKSNVKDNETIISLVKDIDNIVKDYDDKIKSLTTTETTTAETTTEKTTEKSTPKDTTKSTNSSNTTTKSNGNSSSNTTKQNTTKSTTKYVETTTKKKNYKPAPAYGTVVTSQPNPNDYEDYLFHSFAAYYTWEDGEWYLSHYRVSGGMDSSEAYNYASPYISEPNRNGKYEGEEVKVLVWIWG
ncbi:MAG: hypothetical protein NC213_04100 [Acetobacter sp.]|nr:hypothetical protein [Bacteroides sp.]MCM1340906.1 hypothetical protein [Acetobacter sp.]MCM1432538.1 hypothetical protein [Clostridiales bacterium]